MIGEGDVCVVLLEAVLAANADRSARRSADVPLGGKLGITGCNAGVDESFQDNIEISNV
jgi:hypothetical protein